MIKVDGEYYLYLENYCDGNGVKIPRSLAMELNKYFSVKENRKMVNFEDEGEDVNYDINF